MGGGGEERQGQQAESAAAAASEAEVAEVYGAEGEGRGEVAPFGGDVGVDGGDVEGADCGGGWGEGWRRGGEGLNVEVRRGELEGSVYCDRVRVLVSCWTVEQIVEDRDGVSAVGHG